MPRGRKPANGNKPASLPFLDAMRFIGTVLKDAGTPLETHVLLSNNWAVGSNSIVTIGCPVNIIEGRQAAPNHKLITEALNKCGQDVTIDKFEDSDHSLSIKSGKFKAIIPCIDPVLLNIIPPDTSIAPITNAFKLACEILSPLISENAQQIYMCSILMNGRSVVATEGGKVVVECWHGIDLPPGLSIPKTFINSLSKISKNLISFGYSQNSVTFYFEDQSWIKSQLYKDPWPDIAHILNKQSNALSIPKDLFIGIEAVAPFAEAGLIYFDNNAVRSHKHEQQGASYEVAGLPRGPIFNIKQIMFIKNIATKIDFFVEGQHTMFFGDNVRGLIAGRRSE